MWGNIMKTNLTRHTLINGGYERKQAIMDELDKSIDDLEQRFANEEKLNRLEADSVSRSMHPIEAAATRVPPAQNTLHDATGTADR
jgi:hypothetical protein